MLLGAIAEPLSLLPLAGITWRVDLKSVYREQAKREKAISPLIKRTGMLSGKPSTLGPQGECVMTTVETVAVVCPNNTLTIQLPSGISPGPHRVVLVIEQEASELSVAKTPAANTSSSEWPFPVIDVGPWPEGLSLRREDMYGDDGR